MIREVCLTENPLLTERHFLSNELGVLLHCVQSTREAFVWQKKNSIVLIASTNPSLWIETLKALPEKSVIFFLLGNETYAPEIFNSLNGVMSIKHVFVYNLPTEISLRSHFFSFLGDLIDCLSSRGWSNITGALSDLRASRGLHFKFRQINCTYPLTRFPQGYSAGFFEGLQNTGRIPAGFLDSLIEFSQSRIEELIHVGRPLFVSFVGQRTNRRRDLCLKLLLQHESTLVKVSQGFGGISHKGDSSYVDSLYRSKFIAIPPGHFNNQNHRYLEALLVGAAPLILSSNSIDVSASENWTNKLNVIVSRSFFLLLKVAKKMCDDERTEIIRVELERSRNETLLIRHKLKLLLEQK